MKELVLKEPEGNVESRVAKCDFCLENDKVCVGPVAPKVYTTIELGYGETISKVSGYIKYVIPMFRKPFWRVRQVEAVTVFRNSQVEKSYNVDICSDCVKQLHSIFKDIPTR